MRQTLIARLETYAADMKTYKHLRGKLENRRLDYDSKMNKLQKVKKENPALDEELRTAQQKYEETLKEVEELMVTLNDSEEPQMDGLLAFLDAQLTYHQQCLSITDKLKSVIKDT